MPVCAKLALSGSGHIVEHRDLMCRDSYSESHSIHNEVLSFLAIRAEVPNSPPRTSHSRAATDFHE